MRRRGTWVQDTHHGLGLLMAGGALLVLLTGLGLNHPRWLGRATLAPRAIAADPDDLQRLLRAGPALLEESRDGGRTWRDLPLLHAPDHPVAMAFGPGPARTVWLLGAGELLRSQDGGAVWAPVLLPAAVDRREPPVALAVTAGGLPVVATAYGAWIGGDETGAWHPMWRFAPSRGDRLRDLVRRLHSGHWGPPAMGRLYDWGAVLFVAVLLSGLVLGWWRRGRWRRRA